VILRKLYYKSVGGQATANGIVATVGRLTNGTIAAVGRLTNCNRLMGHLLINSYKQKRCMKELFVMMFLFPLSFVCDAQTAEAKLKAMNIDLPPNW
jgi:hypothetical protein